MPILQVLLVRRKRRRKTRCLMRVIGGRCVRLKTKAKHCYTMIF